MPTRSRRWSAGAPIRRRCAVDHRFAEKNYHWFLLGQEGELPERMLAAAPDAFIDRVFIGSCTNSRIEDLRVVAAVVEGRRVADHVRAMVVPGSGLVKRQAEAEGIDRILRAAGFDWREPGCSMCVGMNADRLLPGERCAATSNRNFENRQGRGGRTHLMSPALAAASAIAGCIADPASLTGKEPG